MVRVIIGIEESKEVVHRIVIEVRRRDEDVSIESCIEELLALSIGWAKTWLRYPDVEISIRNEKKKGRE